MTERNNGVRQRVCRLLRLGRWAWQSVAFAVALFLLSACGSGHSITNTHLVARFDYSMQPLTVDANNDGVIDRYYGRDDGHGRIDGTSPVHNVTPTAAQGWGLILDGCASKGVINGYQWHVARSNFDKTAPSADCRKRLSVPTLGIYKVTLTITDAGHHRATLKKDVPVKDWLIVSIGDSVASGEGNPDVYGRVHGLGSRWSSRRCHRSPRAASARAALQLEKSDPRTSVTFIHVACSGATVDRGLLGPFKGKEPKRAPADIPPQIAQVEDLIGDRQVDALLISVGANDIGFAKFLEECIKKAACWKQEDEVQHKLGQLPAAYASLAACINPIDTPCSATFPDSQGKGHGGSTVGLPSLGVSPSHVYITEYFDPTHDEDGHYCDGIFDFPFVNGIQAEEARWADDAVLTGHAGDHLSFTDSKGKTTSFTLDHDSLNPQVEAAAERWGWDYVGRITATFRTHGYCSKSSWIVHLSETLRRQGNIAGTFHPNENGHVFTGRVLGHDLVSALR
jgi:hypothetical protein